MREGADGWVSATLAGFRAMGASDTARAGRHWLAARDALSHPTSNDPLHAAGQTNAGAAHILLRQAGDAEATLADAERRWMQLLGSIATADVPIFGRSSAFHFSLASQNIEAFRNAQRRRLSRLCEAGLALTRFNRLLASATASASMAVVPALAERLSDLLGPRSPEVRLLLETPEADSHYSDKIAAFEPRSAAAMGPATDDWRRLEIAVFLTVLLPPRHSFDADGGLQTPTDAGPLKTSSTR